MICFATLLHGQTFLTVKTIKYENNRISAYNVQGYVVYQVDCKDFVWQRNPDLTIKIWDDIHSYTVNSTSLTSPAWAVVEDSLRAWQTNCSIISTSSTNAQTNLDTSQVDTSLVLPLFLSEINNTLKLINSKGYDSSQVDTSLIVPLYLNEIKEILFAINAKTTDSTHQDTSFIVPVYLEQIKDLLAIINNKTQDTTQTDTSIIVPSYLSQIAQTLDLINSRAYDSSQVDTSLIVPTLIQNINNILDLINSKTFDSTQTDTSLVMPILLANTNDILSNILSKNIDTTHIDTSLVVPIMLENIGTILNNILAKNVDTTNQDTSFINYINQFERNNDTLSAILAAINNSGGNDTSNYWILDSIYKELKSVDTFCLTGEIAVKDSLLRTTVVDCNGINALNVKVCNSTSDTSNAWLLKSIIDSVSTVITELKVYPIITQGERNIFSAVGAATQTYNLVNTLEKDMILYNNGNGVINAVITTSSGTYNAVIPPNGTYQNNLYHDYGDEGYYVSISVNSLAGTSTRVIVNFRN